MPLREVLLQESEQRLRLVLSDYREQGAVLLVARGMKAARVLRAKAFDVAPPARARMRIGMSRPVAERHQRARRHRAGLVEVALQRRHRAPPRRAHFALLEGRLERHLEER